MPKEITHWLIAQKTASGLGNTFFKKPLESNRNCLMLGAVFHDALFYLPVSHPLAGFKPVAERLHGHHGEDTFEVVRSASEAVHHVDDPGPIISFLVGLVSHIETDAAFHPLIYYHSDHQDPIDRRARSRSIQAHRRLETLIDLYFLGDRRKIKVYGLRRFLDQAEAPPKRLLKQACRGLVPPKNLSALARAFAAGWERWARVQPWLQNRFLSAALYGLKGLFPLSFKEIAALAYAPQLTDLMSKVSGQIKYRHPVTGREAATNLEVLFERAVAESVGFCRLIEPRLLSGRIPPSDLAGPSLASGLLGTSRERLTCLSPTPLIGP